MILVVPPCRTRPPVKRLALPPKTIRPEPAVRLAFEEAPDCRVIASAMAVGASAVPPVMLPLIVSDELKTVCQVEAVEVAARMTGPLT